MKLVSLLLEVLLDFRFIIFGLSTLINGYAAINNALTIKEVKDSGYWK